MVVFLGTILSGNDPDEPAPVLDLNEPPPGPVLGHGRQLSMEPEPVRTSGRQLSMTAGAIAKRAYRQRKATARQCVVNVTEPIGVLTLIKCM